MKDPHERTYGSVRGVRGNPYPYRDPRLRIQVQEWRTKGAPRSRSATGRLLLTRLTRARGPRFFLIIRANISLPLES
jgi:hypothetical protein